jgi:hypothetical protein
VVANAKGSYYEESFDSVSDFAAPIQKIQKQDRKEDVPDANYSQSFGDEEVPEDIPVSERASEIS